MRCHTLVMKIVSKHVTFFLQGNSRLCVARRYTSWAVWGDILKVRRWSLTTSKTEGCPMTIKWPGKLRPAYL
ncbi:hypothetical protein K443DRAFT_352184 [Laccaria amethystina LaAM-08-1]|uniref:Uncharacterized protein n=1 Tax=Laccaria amethystina LaAM-08-1 TaxID=1095629 RepID=A0A0C9Y5F5_9AGAR|nr:hypothetical protein K443DRAFT_352184 [Laccaria amethystina LaAM-08-1]